MTGGAEQQPRAPGACWALVGPTAVGKTEVALALGRREDLEVVAVDSMQVYRGMDIGTAKPTPRQRAEVPHHMIDVLEPGERCNVARFCGMARRAMRGIRQRGRRPLLVGGSPMYLKGLLWGLMPAPPRDPQVRERLRRRSEREGSGALHRRLERLDPEAAQRIHPNDVQRLVRALEVCELTGAPISEKQDQFDGEPQIDHIMLGLRRPRPELYRRINRRVDRMMEAGLVEEVRFLRHRLGPQASQALGYKQLVRYLEGEISLEEAVRLIKRDTRRYARHQLTWFRHFPELRWVEAGGEESASELAARCRQLFETAA